MTKKIVFLTGTRADFGKLKPLIENIEKANEFECYIFVTGMHTLSKYGSTFTEVQKHNYKNTFIYMNQTHTTDTDIILSNTITGFSNFIKEIKPDLVVIHGDRIEALAGAIVGLLNNILVAHVEGGELSGTVDEMIRHTITKLSTIHFVSNDDAKKRLIQMGELAKTVFTIGSPDIDIMTRSNLPDIKSVKEHYQISFEKYSILIFHPITTELQNLQEHIIQVVSGVIKSDKNYVVIYPNNDPGSNIIFQEFEKLKKNNKFKLFPTLRFEYFLTLLKNADFILGNSSVGIREAQVYGTPTINIGTRQQNRTQNKHIVHIQPLEEEILNAINKVEGVSYTPSYDFGDGKSSERFLKIMKQEEIWKISIPKQFIDFKNN